MKIEKVIIALDFNCKNKAKEFIDKFTTPVWFKVGMELTYADGFEIIEYIKNKGHKIFLDLKLFDIPNTVFKAIKSLQKYKIDMLTIHGLGGKEMLEEAKKAAGNINLLGVTILTSTNQDTLNNNMMIKDDMLNAVKKLTLLAKKSNLYGVVCSPKDIKNCKDINIKFITPGIRRIQDASNDQKRITTPKEAKKLGSDYIVVGRPITQSKKPVETYKEIVEEFK